MIRFLPLCLLPLLCANGLSAQVIGPGHTITCAMRDTAENAFMPAPAAFLNGEVELKTTFDLVFSDNVPAVAQAAMLFAANVWGSYLDSDVPVRVEIDWTDRDDDRLLASAGPSTLFRDFFGGVPNTWYPVALAEAIAGRDLNDPDEADITVSANSTANWYFGTDGNTPRNRIDLVSVMLHELGHGLGFLSSVDTINDNQLEVGFGGRFIVYDLFLETEGGVPLTDMGVFTNPSEALLMAVIRNDLVFNGPFAVRENDGEVVPLFAPSTFDIGSSVSHLSESEYRAGSENALMTPFLSAGEAVHDPGPITLGIFADMGWPLDFVLTSSRRIEREELRVYPNPASGEVNVELAPESQPNFARIMTADGRIAKALSLSGGSSTIPLAGLPPGIYVIMVQDRGRILQTKILVE